MSGFEKIKEIKCYDKHNPQLINQDPYGTGWILKLKTKIDNEPSLLSADKYRKLII